MITLTQIPAHITEDTLRVCYFGEGVGGVQLKQTNIQVKKTPELLC